MQDVNPPDTMHSSMPNQSVGQTQGPKDNKTSKKLMPVLVVLVIILAVFTIYHIANSSKSSTVVTATNSLNAYSPAVVDITKTGFVPATISVKVGQAVAWTNKDSAPHLIASDPYPSDSTLPTLNSQQQLNTNDSYTYIFKKAGTFTYHDNLNPKLEGTVIVK